MDNVKWIPSSIPPPHGKDVLLQERESNILYVGHYNQYTQKYIFCDFVINVKYWTELPKAFNPD